MADNKKFSTPSTSKQIETKEQDVYDVEKFVRTELKKSEVLPDLNAEYKYVLIILNEI